MAGYSSRTVIEKLGIRPGMRVFFINPPSLFAAENEFLLRDVEIAVSLDGVFDEIHLFTTQRQKLEQTVPKILKHMKQGGMLWISWPKKASRVASDITEQTLRDVVLPTGWVDVKVCAIDDIWSALKFVRRTS